MRLAILIILLTAVDGLPVAQAQSIYGNSDARVRGNRLVPRTNRTRQYRGPLQRQHDADDEYDPRANLPQKKKKRGQTIQREEGWKYFNEGIIALRENRPLEAKQWFIKAESAKYWPAKTQLFLGETEMELGRIQEADRRFEAALETGEHSVEAPAFYYRGLIRTQIGQEARAVSEFLKAERAFEMFSTPRTAKYRRFASQALLYYRTAHWSLSLTSAGYFNSNISQLTLGEVSPLELGGGLATGGVLTSLYAAWASPMARATQILFENYLSLNRNFNDRARDDEYLTDTATLTVAFGPERVTSGGVRLIGSWLLKSHWSEQRADSYRMYDVGFDGGPYLRHRFTEDLSTEIGAFIRFHHNHVYDPLSGRALILNTVTRLASYHWAWHPEFRLNLTQNLPDDDESKSSAWGVGFSNLFQLSDRNTGSIGADFYWTKFFQTSYAREDRTLFVKVSDTHYLGGNLSAVAELSYSRNLSNYPEYFNYNGASLSLGAVWSIF